MSMGIDQTLGVACVQICQGFHTGPIDGLPCTVVTARVDTGFSTRVFIILGKS